MGRLGIALILTYSAYFGPVGSDGTLTQILLGTIAGATYNLRFYLDDHIGGTPNDMSVTWNGTTVFSRLDNPAEFGEFPDVTPLDIPNLTGIGGDTLQFSFRNDPGFWQLDDVSVTETAGAPVPEPASLLLLGTGCLAGIRRFRARGKQPAAC